MASIVRDSAGIEIVESSAPLWRPGEGWTVGASPLFVIPASDGRDETLPLDPTSVDVDTRGRIVVGDGNQVGWNAVLVYDSLGRFLFRAGGEGQGPGEFQQLWWASAYRGDSLVAFDMAGDRLSIFSPEGGFVRAFRTPSLPPPPIPRGTSGYTAGADAAYGDGHFLAYPIGSLDISGGPGPAWFEHLLLRVDPDGEAWDTLGVFGIHQDYWTGTREERLWFGAIALSAVGRDELFFGRGESYEIALYDASGRLVRVSRTTQARRPVTDELVSRLRTWYADFVGSSPGATDEAIARTLQMFERGQFSDSLPAYSAMLLDDTGHLWVEEFRWVVRNARSPLTDPTRWSVFTPQGVWLGQVEVPTGFVMHAVTADRALGFVIDELGVKDIHAYELIRDS
jgi:hypothetical protein